MASIVHLLGEIVNIVSRVGECVVPPVKRQLNYACCYSNNIKDLEDEVEKLEDVKAEVKLDVDAARRNLEIIGPRVRRWLLEVDKIGKNKNDLMENVTRRVPHGCCMCGMCPNLKLRYVLSRRAKKMTNKLVKLRDEGKFGRVSYPPPPLGMIQMDTPSYQIEHEMVELEESEILEERIVVDSQGNNIPEGEINTLLTVPIVVGTQGDAEMNTLPIAQFESDNKIKTRKFIEESIVNALHDPNVSVTGLCGMGGVGKTTMVGRIEEVVKERKMFDEVVTVVVTQQKDLSKIQNSIAEMLGLKLEGVDLRLRAIRLKHRIVNGGSILVILDDIWKRLDLMEIGIPSGIEDCTCKILLTSRARDVCIQMGAQKIFALEVLSLEEAWILFSEEAGISDEYSPLYAIGKEVANECKGLPIALLSVARALKGRSKQSWEDALVHLKRSISTNIIGVQANAYCPLELSYSQLESTEAKSLFILCSLFQEKTNICIEDLLRYGFGLTIFKDIENLREGRNRAHALIEILKDRFLLADGDKEGYVKMHNAASAVAMFIRSKDEHVSMINGTNGWWSLKNSFEQCTHASLISTISTMVPKWLNCPNLVFLLWDGSYQKLTDPEITFNKLRALHVLDLRCVDSLELPSSIQQLMNLRVLRFYNCTLENISMIGYLVNLEILSLQGSDTNNALPTELGKLGKLRLLDLTECKSLHQTTSDVIARLVELEELYLPKNFEVWDVEKFEDLRRLTTLKIVIGGQRVVSQKMQVFSKLKEYDISMGAMETTVIRYHDNISDSDKRSFQKAMSLFLQAAPLGGEWITVLLENVEDLRVVGDGFSSVMLETSLRNWNMKQLAIHDCKTVEHLLTTSNGTLISLQFFPVLESLYLHNLDNLKEICRGKLPERSFGELRYLHLSKLAMLERFCSGPMPNNTLSNLRSIYICDCGNLRSLFCMSVARSLLQLEELEVENCQEMKLVFSGDRKDDTIVAFPKLNKLVLKCLHGATSFVTANRISFPQLMQLKMQVLPRFKGFCSNKSNRFSNSAYNTDRQILFNKEVVCPRITRLALESLNSSKIFSHRHSAFLPNLLFLKVDACQGLKTIFSPSIARALVKIKEIRIKNCRMLVEVMEIEKRECGQAQALFSELEFLEVNDCPKLRSVIPLSVARGLVKLKELRVISCDNLVEVIGKDGQEQTNTNAVLFPELWSMQLYSIPSVKSFCNVNYDFQIPSLHKVVIDKNSPLRETLMKVAKNAGQTLRRQAELASSRGSIATRYASCQSHLCEHEEKYEDGDGIVHTKKKL